MYVLSSDRVCSLAGSCLGAPGGATTPLFFIPIGAPTGPPMVLMFVMLYMMDEALSADDVCRARAVGIPGRRACAGADTTVDDPCSRQKTLPDQLPTERRRRSAQTGRIFV